MSWRAGRSTALAGSRITLWDALITLWDALIIEAARSAGCDRVLTEDFQAGQDFHGITVENPFAR